MLFAQNNIKISPCLLKLQFSKVGSFLRHSVENKNILSYKTCGERFQILSN